MPKVEHSFVRPWDGTPADLLARLRASLEQAGFRLTAPSYWTLQGEGGASVAMSRQNLPLAVGAAVTQAPDGAVLAEVNLADRMPVPLGGAAVERAFRERFAEIESGVDVALGFVSPAVPVPSPPVGPTTTAPVPTPHAPAEPPAPAIRPASGQPSTQRDGLGERVGAAWERITAKTQEKAAAVIGRDDAESWQKVESVTFWCPPEQSTANAERIQVYAAVAAMVASQPGALPDQLADQLTEFTERLRSVLNAAGEADMDRVRCDIEPAQRPIVEFLEQQARMREQLPVRTLHRCRDCGQQKVSNPDYQKLKDRNRKMQALTGAVGLSLRGGSASPFVLVGALFRLKKLDPDYVCARCQGMDAQESIATFCPECGSLRSEAVLRRCSECNHDLRSGIAPLELWHE